MKKLVGSLLTIWVGVVACGAGILQVIETNFTTQPLTKVLYLRCNNPYYYAKTNADSTYTANFVNVVAGTNQLELKRPSGSFVYSFVIPSGLGPNDVVDAYTLYSGLPPTPVTGAPWTNWFGFWGGDIRSTNWITTKNLNVLENTMTTVLYLTNPAAIDTDFRARVVFSDDGYLHSVKPIQAGDNIFLEEDGKVRGVTLSIGGSAYIGGDLIATNGTIFIRAGGLVVGSGTFSITNVESVATFVESGTNVLSLTTNALTAHVPLYGSGVGVTNIPIAGLTASGTRNSSTFLCGDSTWATPAGGAGTLWSTVGNSIFPSNVSGTNSGWIASAGQIFPQ